MTLTDIISNIDERLAEAQSERSHLEGARAALVNGGSSPAAATAPRARRVQAAPKAQARTAKAEKPKYETVPVGKLTALLGDSEGMRTRQISHATEGDPAQILALLKEQEVAGEVRRSGERAGTRWHLVTDEDRIAARAAELEAQGGSRRARRN